MLILAVLFSIILSAALLVVYYFVSYVDYNDMSEKMTPFECGFDPLSNSRTPFSSRFFLLVVLFLIFDVEVALLFPMLGLLSSSSSSFMMGLAMLTFLGILLLGTFHEWNEGALDWVSN
uniref:NADH-ubiquinone oxidoreductase chain 3 n=1 Tax=Bullacta caurina TaxID=2510888 RepID=A0A4D6BK79_9GAST|nr:NADH dehydrogenase subunit 3 [Bullacta caurina]QBX88149.1 NADH dehydrogenase subunit 3 [Bullacta caurina]